MQPIFNQGVLQGTVIEQGKNGNYFRVSTYKTAAGVETKSGVLVTKDSIGVEIKKIDDTISKLTAQKTVKQDEIDQMS